MLEVALVTLTRIWQVPPPPGTVPFSRRIWPPPAASAPPAPSSSVPAPQVVSTGFGGVAKIRPAGNASVNVAPVSAVAPLPPGLGMEMSMREVTPTGRSVTLTVSAASRNTLVTVGAVRRLTVSVAGAGTGSGALSNTTAGSALLLAPAVVVVTSV